MNGLINSENLQWKDVYLSTIAVTPALRSARFLIQLPRMNRGDLLVKVGPYMKRR